MSGPKIPALSVAHHTESYSTGIIAIHQEIRVWLSLAGHTHRSKEEGLSLERWVWPARLGVAYEMVSANVIKSLRQDFIHCSVLSRVSGEGTGFHSVDSHHNNTYLATHSAWTCIRPRSCSIIHMFNTVPISHIELLSHRAHY